MRQMSNSGAYVAHMLRENDKGFSIGRKPVPIKKVVDIKTFDVSKIDVGYKPPSFLLPEQPKKVKAKKKLGRNVKCPFCSSGKKFKKCCGSLTAGRS